MCWTSELCLPGLFNGCGKMILLSREAAVMCVDDRCRQTLTVLTQSFRALRSGVVLLTAYAREKHFFSFFSRHDRNKHHMVRQLSERITGLFDVSSRINIRMNWTNEPLMLVWNWPWTHTKLCSTLLFSVPRRVHPQMLLEISKSPNLHVQNSLIQNWCELFRCFKVLHLMFLLNQHASTLRSPQRTRETVQAQNISFLNIQGFFLSLLSWLRIDS